MERYKSIYSENLSLVFLDTNNETINHINQIISESNYTNCYVYYLGDNDEFNFYLDDVEISFRDNKLHLKKNKFNYISIPFHKVDRIEYKSDLDDGVMELFIKNKKNPIVINFIF